MQNKYKLFLIICLSCVILITIEMYNYNQIFSIKYKKSLPSIVQQFAQNLSQSNISLILIDGSLLFKIIDSNHRNILIKRKLFTESFVENSFNIENRIISFAILEKDVSRLETIIEKYAYKKVEGINGSKRHWNNTENDNSIIASLHYLIYLNDIILQITVFYSRNEFYWSGKLSTDAIKEFQLLNTKIQFGLNEQAFDKFNLERILTADNVSYFIPEETAHFISEIDSSRFVECNFESNRFFRSNYEQVLVESIYVNGKALEAIIAMKKLMKQLFLPFWISSGTLLGWYRQCGVIPFTSDIDFDTWARYASKDITDKFIKNKVGLNFQFIYGLIENGYQYALYSQQSFRVDLFFVYKEGNNYTTTGHIPDKNAYFRYIYPQFTICSAELIGVKVLVPCNAEPLLRAEYGSDWKIPNTFWSYVDSAQNTGPIVQWKKEEQSKIVYREFPEELNWWQLLVQLL